MTYNWDSLVVEAQKNHYHALGIIAANFNLLEYRLLGLFLIYFGHNDATVYIFTKNKDNATRVDFLSRAITISDDADETKLTLRQFIEGFNICAENRNILMHSTTRLWDFDDIEDDDAKIRIFFRKSSKKSALESNTFVLDLAALRRVADEIESFSEFGLRLYNHLIEAKRITSDHILTFFVGGPLPEKPPLPKKLTPQETPTLQA